MSLDLFYDFLSKNGAEFGELTGKKVVQSYGDVIAERHSLTEAVALIDLTSRSCMAVLGEDRGRSRDLEIVDLPLETRSKRGFETNPPCFAFLPLPSQGRAVL